MPIQFRCASCQQLLGIAKRKAGTVVPCPTCSAKTLVPQTTSEPPPVVKKRGSRRDSTQPASIFDRVDMDKLLERPGRPETAGDSAVTVAPPPVRRQIIFKPDPDTVLTPPPSVSPSDNEPKALPSLADEDEPSSDEPFTLASMPVLKPSRADSSRIRLAVYLLLAGIAFSGAFLLGHWIGANRPLF